MSSSSHTPRVRIRGFIATRLYRSQSFFQEIEGGVQTRLDGRYGATQYLGHLVELETLIDLELDRLTLVGRQPLKRTFDGERQLHRVHPIARVPGAGLGIDLAIGPVPAKQRKRLIVGDPVQPGGKSRDVVKFSQVLVRLQED